MSATVNPAAPHHLPAFITQPGETDVFLVGAGVFLLLMVVIAGSLYFRLHALPEHLAHKNASKLQFEVVAVLALLALFTHNNAFWVAALLLAIIPMPDLYAPLAGMAESLARMAGWRRAPAVAAPSPDPSLTALDEIAAIVRTGAGIATPDAHSAATGREAAEAPATDIRAAGPPAGTEPRAKLAEGRA